MAHDVLALQHLRFTWPGDSQPCLDIEDFRLAPGEAVFLHGPSGCGKSTLLSLAAGVLPAREGEVQLLGIDWRRLGGSARDRRRADHVGYLFQQFNLLPYLSVRDNVLLPCRFSARRHERAAQAAGTARSQAEQLLQRMGLAPDLWGRPALQLSVGQQQRVAAARALIGQPELVVADEPTSALDEDRRDAFLAVLLQACEAHRSALLFVSHDRRTAALFERQLALPELNRAPPDTAA